MTKYKASSREENMKLHVSNKQQYKKTNVTMTTNISYAGWR